jgi:CheY-like chemotaxis protein
VHNKNTSLGKNMNKIIEADFFPRESDLASSWPGSIARSAVEEERRILIVDNDQDSTHVVKILLERTGRYLVLEENDATKAHLSARNFRPDLILLDIVMPETDGGEVAAQIQADPVDGIFGPATRDAVAKYQIANQLNVTGSLSPDTLQSLGLPQVTPS